MDEYFEVFIRENYRKFVAYCISRGEDFADADEIVGEAFVRLHTKWNERCSFDKDQNKKWMYNTIEYIRKEYKKNSRKTEADDIDEHSEYLEDGTEIDENLRYEELLKTIGQDLSESDRELFQLVYVEEKSYSEVCELKASLPMNLLHGFLSIASVLGFFCAVLLFSPLLQLPHLAVSGVVLLLLVSIPCILIAVLLKVPAHEKAPILVRK